MNSEYLLILSAHINSQEKIDVIKNTLSQLKHIDVCISTHTNYKLENFKDCRFIVYDNDNEMLHRFDYIDNADVINPKKMFHDSYLYYDIPPFELQRHIPGGPHIKAAMTLLRNGISIASNYNYKWIVYIEYDLEFPSSGIHQLIEETIENCKKTNSKSFFCTHNHYPHHLWGGFIVAKTEIFTEDLDFRSNWENKREWIKIFGNNLFENCVKNILIKHKYMSIDLIDFIKKNYKEDSERVKYHLINGGFWNYKAQNFSEKVNYYLNIGLYPYKIENDFGVHFVILHTFHEDTLSQCKVKNVKITLSNGVEILHIEEIDTFPGYWYFNNICESIEKIKQQTGSFYLQYTLYSNDFLFERIERREKFLFSLTQNYYELQRLILK